MNVPGPSSPDKSQEPPTQSFLPQQVAPPVITLNDSNTPLATTSSPSPSMITYQEGSSTTTELEFEREAIVGGTTTQFASKQLHLINTLHDIGLDLDLDLPTIAVIGSQSSGKSSLIYSTTGVPLPRAPGDACTRCPIECRLTRRDEPWSCTVFLRRILSSPRESDSFGLSKEQFGEVVWDKELLENRILGAQLAILNPNTPARTFLNEDIISTATTERTFSPDIVCLEITGPDYSDLSFVDLPGLIRNVGTTGDRNNIGLIEELASYYVSKPNCIILMTITCETDFANQGAYDLARTYDPSGERTVGVLTKPDTVTDAAHEKWVRYIGGEIEPLHHGWFCVKQHDTALGGDTLPPLVDVHEYEDQYFNKTPAWRKYGRNRLGIKKLVRHLEDILSKLISAILPDFNEKVRELQDITTNELEHLGKPVSDDSVGEINALVDQLVRDIEGGIERRSRSHGDILNQIEAEAVKFTCELRATCPEFRAWNQDSKTIPSVTPLPELFLADGSPPISRDKRKIIYLDEVLGKKTRSSARGLPDGEKNEVAEEYVRSFTANWSTPTDHFVKEAHTLLRRFIHKKIDSRCGNFADGGLPSYLCEIVEGRLNERLEKTQAATRLLLKLEQSAHTRNERFFRECKEIFLNNLRMQRELALKNPVLQDLNRMATQEKTQPHASFVSSINTAKAALGKAGIPLTDVLQLGKLLPPHPTDPALEDMAKASAGFEVAFRRFVDYIPLVVDTELVRGFYHELASTLRRSFRFSEPNAAERCRELLREPLNIQEDRARLRQRLQRLSRAEEELRNFWFQGPAN